MTDRLLSLATVAGRMDVDRKTALRYAADAGLPLRRRGGTPRAPYVIYESEFRAWWADFLRPISRKRNGATR